MSAVADNFVQVRIEPEPRSSGIDRRHQDRGAEGNKGMQETKAGLCRVQPDRYGRIMVAPARPRYVSVTGENEAAAETDKTC